MDVPDAGASAMACKLPPPSSMGWRLVAEGTRLVDGLGRTVFLRGVDGGGRSKFAPFVPFDYAPGEYASALEKYMSHAEQWGIDAMRVPFTWTALEGTKGVYDESWLGMYAELLASAWAHGIYTVVDFHQDVYSEVYCGDGFPGWTVEDPPAPAHDCPAWGLEYFSDKDVEQAFDAFWGNTNGLYPRYLSAWDEMIRRFKDTPGVLGFEIINEPSSGTEDETTFEVGTLSAFYVEVAKHMRAEAPDDLVFVDATGIDGVTVTTSIRNPGLAGVVFAPHFYPLASPSPSAVRSELEAWAKVGTAWNVPVFLGEFGTSNTNPGAEPYIASVFGAIDSLGLSGAAEWEYSTSKELWNSETDTVVGPDGTEYPVARALIRPYARAVAGTTITQSWNDAKEQFSLSYAPASGTTDVTEVRLPTRAFPAGYTVTLAGGCYDASSVPGEMLVKATAGTEKVTLTLASK
jgi:endoglycosylceramidase